jgi:hypothetical protein
MYLKLVMNLAAGFWVGVLIFRILTHATPDNIAVDAGLATFFILGGCGLNTEK